MSRKHTRATPANVSRSRRSRLTRRNRRALAASRYFDELWAKPIIEQLEGFAYRNKLKWTPGRRERFVLSPELFEELAEGIRGAYAVPGHIVAVESMNFLGFPVVVEHGWHWREWMFTTARTSGEQRDRELWVRQAAMTRFMEHDWAQTATGDMKETAFAVYLEHTKFMHEFRYDEIQDQASYGR